MEHHMTKQEPITMANHANVHVALAAAQADMRLPEKNAENPGFKRDGKPMKYADLSSVVESIRVPLTRHGLAWGWRSAFSADAGLWVWDAYIVHGASGTEVSCAVPVNSGTGNSHAFKSAVTYAKRIGLESVSGQAPGDDDDGNAAAKSPPVVEDRKQDRFDVAAATNRIKASLAKSDSLDDLRARWQADAETIQRIKAEAPGFYGEIDATKNARKAELEPRPSDSVTADEIPY
jgi:hypothetical protein